MFLFSYRGAVFAPLIIALFSYLLVTNRYAAAQPWIDGTMIALIAVLFIRIWLK
jgi:hypothetical protein